MVLAAERVGLPQHAGEAVTRVVLVDDHTLLRQSVAKLIGMDAAFRVVGEAGNGADAVALALSARPDLMLLDVSLPDMTGLDVAERVRATLPGMRIIFLTMHDDDATVARAIGLGADGYVLKNASTEELMSGVRAVVTGGSFLSPQIARGVLRRANGYHSASGLTARELEILRLLAAGDRPAQIARGLFLSLKTVRNHLASIYVKLDVCTAGQAVGEAFRRGLVPSTF